jgi:hypothetical protein
MLTEIIAHNQFLHLYGQQGARLDRNQSVHMSTVKSRSLLFTFLTPVLLWAPETYLRALEELWVDGLVHCDHWTQFTNKLNSERQEISFIVIFVPFLHVDVSYYYYRQLSFSMSM